ncbi:MAG: helix-turn-helix domain-containing protein [Gemmatimonadota bacterium]|nr:helix-turn-helix domain-containing protein [Gemmatimonadota bacterium]
MLSHEELKRKALANPETKAEYEAQRPEFELLDKLLEARKRAGLTQGQVAEKMGTKPTAITRLESASRLHSPKIETLQKYAEAVGCRLNIELIPE